MSARALTATVLVPTWRRGDDLRRCLGALTRQTLAPDSVLVVHRPDDEQALAVLAGPEAQALPLHPVIVTVPGQVAALNAGLAATRTDILAITDDDAAPHPDWLERIVATFAANPTLAGLGGRDVVHEHGRVLDGAKPLVGRVRWYGRPVGNHHLGCGPLRRVDILKGANMSWRTAAVAPIGFDPRLLGSGAQVANDMMISLAMRRAGHELGYDPAIRVDHFPAPRHDVDQRHRFNPTAAYHHAHNETLALLTFLPRPTRPVFWLWTILVGTRDIPGLLHTLRALLSGKRHTLAHWRAALRGRLAAHTTSHLDHTPSPQHTSSPRP